MIDPETFRVTIRLEGTGRNIDVYVQATSKAEARSIAEQQNQNAHVVTVSNS